MRLTEGREKKEKGQLFSPKRLLAILHGLPLQRNIKTQVDECYCSYLLPVKNEPFSHVIPILIFLEKFTAWKRRAEL